MSNTHHIEEFEAELLCDNAMNDDNLTSVPNIPTCTKINHAHRDSTFAPTHMCNLVTSKCLVKDNAQHSILTK